MGTKGNTYLLIGILCLTVGSGCATPGKSAGAGAITGAGVGATAGLLADPGEGGSHRIRNILIGTGVGGALGAGAGLLIGNSVRDQEQDAYSRGEKLAHSEGSDTPVQQPKLVPARTQARWVAGQIHGNIYIPPHYEYLIIEPAHWEAGQ